MFYHNIYNKVLRLSRIIKYRLKIILSKSYRLIKVLNNVQLKGLAQAKIIKKSVILFRVPNMTI